MKQFGIFKLSILLLSASSILAQCDPKTCQYCCIEVNGVSTCRDEIILCKLVNKRDYFPFVVFVIIVTFWCFAMPICLSCCKLFLVGKFCFGYTIIGGIEMILKKAIKKATKKKHDIRKRRTAEQNFDVLRSQFQGGMKYREKNITTSDMDYSTRLTSKKTFTWKKDDLLAK